MLPQHPIQSVPLYERGLMCSIGQFQKTVAHLDECHFVEVDSETQNIIHHISHQIINCLKSFIQTIELTYKKSPEFKNRDLRLKKKTIGKASLLIVCKSVSFETEIFSEIFSE